jgi:GMP synthase-like glutamine amidotransferase
MTGDEGDDEVEMKENYRFAVLKAGTANPVARKRLGDCDEMFINLLSEPGETWDVYDVEHGVFPEDISRHDGFVITGSRYSVYDDKPWIRDLLELVREIHSREIRLVGVCFGHQAVARALGGEVGLNPKGWDIGLKELTLTEAARGLPPLQKMPSPVRVLVTHMDVVTRMPDEAVRLAYSERTEFEMFKLGRSVLSLQGHPEYDQGVIEEIIDLLSRHSILPADRAEEGRASLSGEPHNDLFRDLLRGFLRGSGL